MLGNGTELKQTISDMSQVYLKIFAVILVFLGEFFAVYAETFGIKYNLFSKNFWILFLLITLGGFLLITGYLLGYKAFNNIWIITVVSLTTFLTAEPIIILVFLKQMPTTGAIIGFILGLLGLVTAILF